MIDYRKSGLGAKKDVHDPRDFIKVRAAAPEKLPEFATLSDLPPIKNQGQRGSCVGHATAWMFEQLLKSRGLWTGTLSPLFIWFYARLAEGVQSIDEGVQMRDGVAALAEHGIALESQFNHDVALSEEPGEEAKLFAASLKIPRYERCLSIQDIRHCIAVEKQSCILSVVVRSNWYSEAVTQSGMIPKAGSSPEVGRHALAVCGYDADHLIFANSWGDSWGGVIGGNRGFCRIPDDVIEDGGFDCWTVQYQSLPSAAVSS